MLELCEIIRDGVLPLTISGSTSFQMGRDDAPSYVRDVLQWRDAQHLAIVRGAQAKPLPTKHSAMMHAISSDLDHTSQHNVGLQGVDDPDVDPGYYSPVTKVWSYGGETLVLACTVPIESGKARCYYIHNNKQLYRFFFNESTRTGSTRKTFPRVGNMKSRYTNFRGDDFLRSSMPRRSDPNRCRASEIEPLSRTKPTRACARPAAASEPPHTPQSRVRRPQPESRDSAVQGSRQLSEDQRTVIFRRYSWWLADGKLEAESPIAALMQEFTVGRQYPKRLYDKVMKHGNVADRVRIGRPSDFSPCC